MSVEIYPDLNEEEYFIMNDSREDHWMDFFEEVDDQKKIHALRWGVYAK